jgi:hypothetical protein
MQAYVLSNIGVITIFVLSILLVESILLVITMRRIKKLTSVASSLLFFERFISMAFRTQIEEFIRKKKSEFVEEELMKHQKNKDLYQMHKNNVSSSPISSRGRW